MRKFVLQLYRLYKPALPIIIMADEKKAGQKAYGKRPLWQWILIYLIIAAIVYGLVYYFFLRGGYGY